MSKSSDYDSQLRCLEEGRRLTPQEVVKTQKEVGHTPSDICGRLRLIGYCFRKSDEAQCQLDQLRWMVDNCPDSLVWRSPLMSVEDKFPPKSFALLREHWLRQIANHPSDPRVIGHAGLFLIRRDFELGDSLLSQAMTLAPLDDFWAEHVSRYNYWRALEGVNLYKKHHAAKALSAGEDFLRLYGSDGGRAHSAIRERCILLCAQCAFWLGLFDKATNYAKEHLKLVSHWDKYPKSSRSLLGLIALRRGKPELAKRELLTFKNISRITELDLELSNELIKIGHRDTVISYLQECKRLGFWKALPLQEWIDKIARGQKFTLKN